jgi:hypothetical protein
MTVRHDDFWPDDELDDESPFDEEFSFYNDGYGRLLVTDLFWEVDLQMRMPWHHPWQPLHQDALDPPEAIRQLHAAFEKDPLLLSVLWGTKELCDRIAPDFDCFFDDALDRAIWCEEIAIIRVGPEQLGWLPPLPGEKPEPHQPPAQTKTWIEVVLVDDRGAPVPGARYRITLPNGQRREGNLNEQGLARLDGIEPGICDVEFPNIDGREWAPRGGS